MIMYVLEAKSLKKSFGKTCAVKEFSLDIAQGECVSLLGPNGAGKTTTVEMLEGLQNPDGGRISLFGKSMLTDREAILEDVGVLLQDTYLYKKLKVRETLELFASFYKDASRPTDVIKQLGLEEKSDARIEHLSGGQKQRLYLGVGLINNPKLVFLDEPTTGLDPQARRLIWGLLEKLKAHGKSILLTTHYMEEAEVLSDRVAIMDHGEIIAHGTPAELIHKTCGEQVLKISFADFSPEKKSNLTDVLSWFGDATEISPGNFELSTEEAVKHVSELTEKCSNLGINITKLNMRTATLEDVFLKLTGRGLRDD